MSVFGRFPLSRMPFRALIAVVVLAQFVGSKPADAIKIGQWEAVCMAPNWRTGELEQVSVSNRPYYPMRMWFARIHRLVNGKWHMDFNRSFIHSARLSDETKIYIFYHECAHARLNNSSERAADCEALRLMRASMNVEPRIVRDIERAYRIIRRTFPTGGPCDAPLRDLEQIALY